MDQEFGQPNQGNQNQGNQQSPQYNPQYQYQNNTGDLNKPMSVGQYMLTMLIGAIPIVGIIMLFVWSFGSNTNVNKKNWARAMLLWALIAVVLYIILIIAFGAAIFGALGNMGGGYGY